jgi:UDP-glucose 4-epimerase
MYSQIYGSTTSIARFFNVYGPRHLRTGPYSTIIGIFEEQYENKQPLTITGDGEQRRDFTHVYDICNGLIDMSKGDHKGTVFNLGTGKNYSINEVAALYPTAPIEYISARPGEAFETLADISAIKGETGWYPKYVLEQYIKDYIKTIKEK